MTQENPSMTARLAALKMASVKELKAMWQALYGPDIAAPNGRAQLEGRLGWRIQELEYGGLSIAAKRKMTQLRREMAAGKTPGRSKGSGKVNLIAGTRLQRDWKGVRHEITVLGEGFEWQGRRYKSLSAIARAITGTRWNGWTFFGIKKG